MDGSKKCNAAKNTFMKYWKKGLVDLIFFPPQIRIRIYKTRKEYIYLVECENPHELFEYYRKHPDVIYLAFLHGKFNLLIQTKKPLDIAPKGTLLHGSRSDYEYPETPYCSFDSALDRMETLLSQEHEPSRSTVTCPDEPSLKGSEYGWKIFPYIKYDLRPNYTTIVKKVGISFSSFYKGYEYLLSVSTVLLPYYPLGFTNYLPEFIVLETDYEKLIREFFSHLPSHVSITRVDDAFLIHASHLYMKERRFYLLVYRMAELGYIKRFWTATPVFHWTPDP